MCPDAQDPSRRLCATCGFGRLKNGAIPPGTLETDQAIPDTERVKILQPFNARYGGPENAGKTAKHDLRRFTAEQSVLLAEQIIKREMRPEDDTRLITRNIDEMGAAR